MHCFLAGSKILLSNIICILQIDLSNESKKSHYLAAAVNCRHGFLNHTHDLYTLQSILIRWQIHSLYFTSVNLQPFHPLTHVFQANWAISPHNGKKKQSTLLLNMERFAKRAFTTELLWCVLFYYFLLCHGGKWRKVCVWIRTYSSLHLWVIMEQCFPVTVDGITFSQVTKAGSF